MIILDMLEAIFGYDKYSEITAECAIRGTYCDLAVKVDEKLVQLVEVKAVGATLDDRHVKQAVDYASNQGVEWVILTNGSQWRLYQVIFAKPIDKRLLCEIDITSTDPKKEECLECLFLFTKEGFSKGAHLELRDRAGATISLGAAARAEYPFIPLHEGDLVTLGQVRLKALETPGHTAESISLVVYDLDHSAAEPKAVLTGDTLFVGDVGRPDLRVALGWSANDLGGLLYDSLRNKLLTLPDAAAVYPAHGAGSRRS